MKRILVVLGTRPEAIKLSPVIRELKIHRANVSVTVCSTGQHGPLVRDMLAEFGLEPDIDLQQMRPGQSPEELLGRLISVLVPVIASQAPDILLCQGDTTSVLAATLVGFLTKCETAHLEGGLRTKDRGSPFPEEMIRRVAGIVADRHFAPTQRAVTALQKEGVSPDRIFLTGNTGIDALFWMAERVAGRRPPASLTSVLERADRIVLVTAHRRENFGRPLDDICTAVRRLAEAHRETTFIFPVHPNPNVRERVHKALHNCRGVHLCEPLPYSDLVWLLLRSHFVLTDSGGLQEEAPALGRPVLVMRESTERLEGVACGVSELVGTDPERIFATASRLLNRDDYYAKMARAVSVYGDGQASQRVARILVSQSTPVFETFRPSINEPRYTLPVLLEEGG